MKSINKVTLIGNVGKDPEMRKTQSGEAIGAFSLATSESWLDKASNQKMERTEWHNITVFGRLADVVKDYVKKGKPLYVEGAIKYETYSDSEGITRNVTKIIVNNFVGTIVLLGTKPPEQTAAESLLGEEAA